jgi:hypothetical protein
VTSDSVKRDEKTDRPLPSLPLAQNGNATNGHGKQQEEPLVITEVPEAVTEFFDRTWLPCYMRFVITQDFHYKVMNSRFKEMLKEKAMSCEILHVATLTQEASCTHI